MNLQNALKKTKSSTNIFYGLNPSTNDEIVQTDHNHKTHVFFTRPQLNLTSPNCILSNELMKLMTENKNSVHRYARLILDPRLSFGTGSIESDIVDPYNPFIPVFSNTLTKISGFPDVVMGTKVSKAGHLKEQVFIADGTTDILNFFPIDLTFKNTTQEPITTILSIWLEYMDKVHKGTIMPYVDMMIRREIDYMSRIYVIITDENDNVIKKIANTGAGIPTSVPMGKFFNWDKTAVNKIPHKDITLRFSNVGMEYNKHNSMLDFNTLVAAFHPKMGLLHAGDLESGMVQVPEELFETLKYRVYPYIELSTNRLLWYIDETQLKIIEEEETLDGI